MTTHHPRVVKAQLAKTSMTNSILRRDLRHFYFWTPILVCFGINSALFAGIALNQREYFLDYKLNNNPDAVHYVLEGRNTLLQGQFSRSLAPPFVPDMVRTPVYPVFAGALDLCGKALAIYLVQALLQVAACVVIYKFVERHFGARAAFFASLFLATDLMWAISNFEAMSEPLFVLLLLGSAGRLSRRSPRNTRARRDGGRAARVGCSWGWRF